MSSRLWQQGLNFANLPLLGSCTYSHSYCPEAPNVLVKMWPIGPLVEINIRTAQVGISSYPCHSVFSLT